MSEITNLEPQSLWVIFQKLCDIPRPSKKEAKVVEYVKEFGENLGLETIIDEIGNVIIKKPATPGMENAKGVVLQAHLDMVPQKNSDKQHDFEKDPIEALIDGEWVTANGTTLGADNGIGVAAAMAVLAAKDIKHGPVEALLTIDEETGMTGAFGLKPGYLNGDILINLDSEDEGELYIGCAGGMDTICKFDFTKEAVADNYKAYKLSVTDLKGGHSGLDIDQGRGNSIKIMNRLLWEAERKFGLRLADLQGGSLRNAIPRESFAEVVVPNDQAAEFEAYVGTFEKMVKIELAATEPNMKVIAQTIDMPAEVIDSKTQSNMLNAIYGMPNGVLGMIAEMPDVVETSTSLGVIKTSGNTIELISLQRSSVDSLKFNTANQIKSVFELAGADVEFSGSYPGWQPNLKSPILNTMKEVYNSNFGKVPEMKVIHAGLECGLIGDVYPNLDLISFGPTIDAPHSPDERVHIGTVEKFWDFLIHTLKNIPQK